MGDTMTVRTSFTTVREWMEERDGRCVREERITESLLQWWQIGSDLILIQHYERSDGGPVGFEIFLPTHGIKVTEAIEQMAEWLERRAS